MYDYATYIFVKDGMGCVLGKIKHTDSDVDTINVTVVALKEEDDDEWDITNRGMPMTLNLIGAKEVEYYEADENFFDKYFAVLF